MDSLLNLAASHPQAALLAILLVACAESLAIVGTLVPAALVMFAAGSLVGAGVLNVWATLAAAATGAIVGDGLSYELGRGQQDRIRRWPLFQRHQSTVARGEDFIGRHGGKSILLARFTGPLRAFVPLLAGFSRMPRTHFYAANLISALLWAPAHILPGVLFGASLQMAHAVSGRLAAILAILVLLVWLVAWLVPKVLRFALPRIVRLRDFAVLRAGSRQGRISRWTLALLDPKQPESKALLLATVLLLAGGWLFVSILRDVVMHDSLVQVDLSVFHFLQALRTTPVDRFMVTVTEIGSAGVMVPLALAVAAWLVWRGYRRTAGYWIGVVAFGEVMVQLLKFTLGRPRPLDLYAGVERFSFPSGHAAAATVMLSFLAFLLCRQQTLRVRAAIAAGAACAVLLIAISRLYLGAHWLSDVLGSMGLGLAWVALVAFGYTERRVDREFAPRGLMLVVLSCFVVFGAVWTTRSGSADLARYGATVPAASMTQDDWLDRGWQRLPANRFEIAGDPEEPLDLQWADDDATLQARLARAGWRPAPPWTVRGALTWLAPATDLQQLPVLPRFDRGSAARLLFQRESEGDPAARDVLRLWRAGFDLQPTAGQPAVPLWYGTVYRETRRDQGRLAGTGVRQEVLAPARIASRIAIDGTAQLRARGGGLAQVLVIPPLR